MSAALRSSTSTNTGATTSTTVTLTLPAGYQPNDLLLVAVANSGGSGTTVTAPTGWTTTGAMSNVQTTNTRLTIYYRVATGYESANYTWTFSTASSASAFMAAYEGANPFVPAAVASTTTATAATTFSTTDVNSSYDTGRGVQIFACNNTTAASTLISGAGFTKQIDTCTTASPYIEICMLDGAKGLPMGGISTNTPTCSQCATSVMMNAYIEDARPTFNMLAQDEVVVGSFSTARTNVGTQAFQTNYPNELILAFLAVNAGSTTVSSISCNGLTFSLVARENTNSGSSEVWCAFAPTPFTNQPVTINYSGSTVSGGACIVGVVGADTTTTTGLGAIGATATGTSSAAAPSISVTSTRNNSWVWSVMNEATASAGSITAGTGQTNVRSVNDTTNACGNWTLRQNALTSITGTSVTMNVTSPSTGYHRDSCVNVT